MIGGSVVYYYYLLSQCTENDVIVIARSNDGSAELDAKSPYVTIRKRCIWPYSRGIALQTYAWIPYILPRMVAWILWYRVSVVHVGCFVTDIIAMWLAAVITRRPIVATVFGEELTAQDLHSVWNVRRWPRVLRRWASRAVLRRCDCVQTCSSFTKQVLIQMGVHPDRIVVTTPGIDVAKINSPKAIKSSVASQLTGKRIVLTVGRFMPRKGHDKVLHAIARLVKEYPDLVYVLVGGVTDLAYRALCDEVIREHHLDNHVYVFENLDNTSVAWLYDACEIFIMANCEMPDGDTEGYGIVFLEAGAFGKPVIGGRAGGVVDAIDDGKTGVLIDGKDVEAIALAIAAFLSDPTTAKQMGEAGRQKALRNAWDVKSREYCVLLDRLASGTWHSTKSKK